MKRSLLLLTLLLAGSLLTGCGPQAAWEQEYACEGREQSSAYFVGADPATAIQREYPLTIDFHLRSGSVMVRSAQVATESVAADALHFGAKNKNFWISGQFSKADQRLTVVDERTLDVAGRAQLIRTTGQYVCKQAGRRPSLSA